MIDSFRVITPACDDGRFRQSDSVTGSLTQYLSGGGINSALRNKDLSSLRRHIKQFFSAFPADYADIAARLLQERYPKAADNSWQVTYEAPADSNGPVSVRFHKAGKHRKKDYVVELDSSINTDKFTQEASTAASKRAPLTNPPPDIALLRQFPFSAEEPADKFENPLRAGHGYPHGPKRYTEFPPKRYTEFPPVAPEPTAVYDKPIFYAGDRSKNDVSKLNMSTNLTYGMRGVTLSRTQSDKSLSPSFTEGQAERGRLRLPLNPSYAAPSTSTANSPGRGASGTPFSSAAANRTPSPAKGYLALKYLTEATKQQESASIRRDNSASGMPPGYWHSSVTGTAGPESLKGSQGSARDSLTSSLRHTDKHDLTSSPPFLPEDKTRVTGKPVPVDKNNHKGLIKIQKTYCGIPFKYNKSLRLYHYVINEDAYVLDAEGKVYHLSVYGNYLLIEENKFMKIAQAHLPAQGAENNEFSFRSPLPQPTLMNSGDRSAPPGQHNDTGALSSKTTQQTPGGFAKPIVVTIENKYCLQSETNYTMFCDRKFELSPDGTYRYTRRTGDTLILNKYGNLFRKRQNEKFYRICTQFEPISDPASPVKTTETWSKERLSEDSIYFRRSS